MKFAGERRQPHAAASGTWRAAVRQSRGLKGILTMHKPLIAAAVLAFAAVPALAADKGLPADQVIAAIQAAVAAQPGDVKEVDVDHKRNNRVEVKVEIVSADGKEHELRIDPATRQVIRK